VNCTYTKDGTPPPGEQPAQRRQHLSQGTASVTLKTNDATSR